MTDPESPADSNDSKTHLEEIFARHREGLAGAVRGVLGAPLDVEEVLQEAFLKLWRTRDHLLSVSNPDGWVFVVTMNVAKDLRRRRGRRGPTASLEGASLMTVAKDRPPGDHLQQSEAVAAARAAIHALDDSEREVFLLRTSGGLKFEAIAESLGIPEGTAKTRMRRALVKLRTALSPYDPFTGERSLA